MKKRCKCEDQNKMLQYAASKLDCDPAYLSYWAFPVVYPTTAGPLGGIGGAMPVTVTIEAYEDGQKVVYFYDQMVLRVMDIEHSPPIDFKP